MYQENMKLYIRRSREPTLNSAKRAEKRRLLEFWTTGFVGSGASRSHRDSKGKRLKETVKTYSVPCKSLN